MKGLLRFSAPLRETLIEALKKDALTLAVPCALLMTICFQTLTAFVLIHLESALFLEICHILILV